MKNIKIFPHKTPFGGLNFVLQEFGKQKNRKNIRGAFAKTTSSMQIFMEKISYTLFWSVYFCGGDCVEDLGGNFHHNLKHLPFFKTPSPDRVLDRFKELSSS